MIKTELQSNNLDLRALLDAINNLPEKGSGGTGEDISEELSAQDALISEISLALDEVAIAQAEVFAAIGVTYPEGSTCTCSNGTKTLTAKDTSGQALFLVPEAGEWTVTSTANDDSGNSKSEIVEITTEEQSVKIELSYTLWLYDSGNEFTDITGGWISNYTSSNTAYIKEEPTKDATSFTIKATTGTSFGAMGTAKKIDLTDYSCIKFNVTGYLSNLYCQFTVNTNTTTDNGTAAAVKEITGIGEYSLDVSKLSGDYYMVFAIFGQNAYPNKYATIDKVLLE